jgi:rhodanese-related sulfurtransferase
MKRTLSVLFAVLMLVVACSGDNAPAEKTSAPTPTASASPSAPASIFQSLDSRTAQVLIDQRQDLLIVDLREAREIREGYIADSLMIPMSALSKGTKSLPSDRPLLLVCAVGGRSYAVGRYFSSKGYPEIYNLKGGISAWKKAGLPLKY